MNAAHLRLLRELADRGSVTAVAAAGHRTASAVSQQLRVAEREAGTALVERVGRGIRLTDAGAALADAALDVEVALAGAQRRLDELRGAPRGVVRLAALPSALEFLLPPCLVALADEPIALEVDDVDVAETDFAALAADVDVVVGHSLTADVPLGAGSLHSTVLCREPIDVAVPIGHPLAQQDRVTPKDIVDEPWIGVPRGYPFDTILEGVQAAAGRTATVRQRIRDNQVVAALVGAGLGIAFLPRFTSSAHPRIALRPLHGVPSVRWVVALSRRERAERAAVRRVVELLAQVAPDG